jgi:peptidoglycan/LPS O-acetylase OafA/YrhL
LTTERQGRILQLDGVRALAIAAVFLHHAFNVRMLWMGVDLFFILSGFLITGILLQHKTQPMGRYFRDFYARRVRRIVPPYLLLLIVATAVFGLAWMRYAYLYVMLMNVIRAMSLPRPIGLGVLWSLAVEEQFYLIWPFAVYLLSEAALGWTAAALVILVPAMRGVCTPLFATHWPIYSLTPFRMDLLLVGALLALAWIHHRRTIERYGHYGLMLVPAAIGVLFYLSKHYNVTTNDNTRLANVGIYEASLVACTGVMLWALSGRWVDLLTLRPVMYLGRISYSVYLIHVTALYLAAKMFHGTWAVASAAAAIALAYAVLSWQFMELPLLGWRPKESSVLLAK